MKHISIAAIFALVLAVAIPAHAGEISYSFVELGYLNLDGDSHGLEGRASIEFGQTGLYGELGGSWQTTRDDYEDEYSIGNFTLGYAHSFSPGTDVVAEIAYNRYRADYYDFYYDEFYSVTAHSYRGSVGAAHAFANRFVLSGKVNRYFGEDLDAGYTTVSVTGEFYANPAWSVLAELESGEDDVGNTYLVGVRYHF